MQLYNVFYLVGDVYNALSAHNCDATAFEIAYLQECQKLDEAREANKSLVLQLETLQREIHKERQAHESALSKAIDYIARQDGKIDELRALVADKSSVDSLNTDKQPKSIEQQTDKPQQEETVKGKSNQMKLRRLAGTTLSDLT